MPSDDLILNVRQIDGYPATASVMPSDAILLQRGGLGGPYLSISPALFVGAALAQGGDMAVGGQLLAAQMQTASLVASNAIVNLFSSQKACIANLSASLAFVGGVPVATTDFVNAAFAAVVHSFEGRKGDVRLWLQDILSAGGAPIFSPFFMGAPRTFTPAPWSNSTRVANTEFVKRAICGGLKDFIQTQPLVFSFNGRSGDIVLTEDDIINAGGGEVFDSPNFTGTPTAPTAPPGTATDQIATTAFVDAALAGGPFAPLASPNFSGSPTAPTPAAGVSDGQLATTAFVMNAVQDSVTGVVSFNTRTGIVTLEEADIANAGGAVLNSPIFTGTPSGPTAAPGTANTQLATTAFVMAALGSGGVTTFNGRSGAVTLEAADLTAAGGALLAGPAFSGVPSAPTAAPGTSTTQLATTAFVMAAVAATVSSFNGRTGAVSLIANDISAAGGAVLASPAFTGVPTGPTAAPGTNSTQLATTAYVQAALAAGGGVLSFNGRAGVVTLTQADVTAVLPAATANPAMNGAASPGSASAWSRGDHVHPTDTSLLPLAGGVMTGPLNPSAGIVGVTNGSNAAAGQVGEFLSNQQTTPVAIGGVGNISSLSLTAGDWDVWGYVAFTSTVGLQFVQAWVSTVSATVPAWFTNLILAAASGALWGTGTSIPAVMQRVNVSATTTVYLSAQGPAGTGVTAMGAIYARRRR